MFLFVAGRTEFGDGRPILAGAFFVLAVLWGLEFALELRSRKDQQSRGEKLKERLQKNDKSKTGRG